MSFIARTQRFHILVLALVTVSVWACASLDVFAVVDGIIYDQFSRLRTRVRPTSSSVLLLRIDPPSVTAQQEDDVLTEDDVVRAVRLLKELGAIQVVFTVRPRDSSSVSERDLDELQDVVWAYDVEPDPDFLDEFRFAPGQNVSRDRNAGAMIAPPSVAGVSRRHFLRVRVGDVFWPSLESYAAARIGESSWPKDVDEFLVHFRGGPESLPTVSLDRLFSRDVIPELVSGRTVVVGYSRRFGEAGLYTPTTSGLERMSVLEYRGHAINTLVQRSSIAEVDHWKRLLLFCGVALASLIVYRSLTIQTTSWLTGGLVLAYGGATLYTLTYLSTWLPVTQLALCQVSVFLVNTRKRALDLTGVAQRLISDSSSQLKDKYWPSQAYSSRPSWALIASMINQTLDLSKLIFLEAKPESAHLSEILSLHCSLNDIIERRRDYSRSPYVDALRVKAPIRVREYMTVSQDAEEEVQYLAPLVFSGELLGFWAIGIEARKLATIPNFDNLLVEYSNKISELLYQSRQADGASGSVGEPTKRRFAVEQTHATYHKLETTLGLLQHRLTTLETLLNRVNAGVIVYDVFGRVLQLNQFMLDLLRKEGLSPFEMSALDLILGVSEYDVSRGRKLLRRVIVDGAAVSFPVTFRSRSDSRFLLHLKPIIEELDSSATEASKRLGARSILCELEDTTATALLYEMKNNITNRMGLELRSHLASIELSSSMLVADSLNQGHREACVGVIHSKVRDSVQILSECKAYLAADADVDELDRLPVEPGAELRCAVDDVREFAEKRQVELAVQEPNYLSCVFGSSKKLRQLFRAILSVLVQDAGEESAVLVRVTEDTDIVAFDFSDMGFGIPNEVLQDYLSGEQALASEDFHEIREIARLVDEWGGMFQATSGVGIGMHFTIHLVKFI